MFGRPTTSSKPQNVHVGPSDYPLLLVNATFQHGAVKFGGGYARQTLAGCNSPSLSEVSFAVCPADRAQCLDRRINGTWANLGVLCVVPPDCLPGELRFVVHACVHACVAF